jgi:hypothetical protein
MIKLLQLYPINLRKYIKYTQNNERIMGEKKVKREFFDQNNVPLLGSLGLLALGDVGFKAWRKVKSDHKLKELNEKK